MKRLIVGLVLVSSLLLSDSFEDKMLKRGAEIGKIPNVFGGKEFKKDTWLSNVLKKGCAKSIGDKRTKCILKNRKNILNKWAKTDDKLLEIAKTNKDKMVWIAQQEYSLNALSEAKIEGKNSWSTGGDKKQKGARLPTLKEITKACYDKNLRKYFYGSTTGYGSNSFKTYFEYKDGGNMYINFKTCKPEYLRSRLRYGEKLVATKYVKNIK